MNIKTLAGFTEFSYSLKGLGRGLSSKTWGLSELRRSLSGSYVAT